MKGISFFIIACFLFGLPLILSEEWSGFDDAAPVENSQDSLNSTTISQTNELESVNIQTEKQYTKNFYLALWAGSAGIALLILFLYLLFKRPKDHFKKIFK